MGNAFGRLFAKLKRFVAANGGNVAMTFGLATIPIIGGVGAAIDFGHAHSVKSAMQSALDATALMISREAATLTGPELQAKAKNYFVAMFDKPEAIGVTVAASFARGSGSQVVVTGSASVATSVMGIIGYNYIAVAGSSTAKWGTQRLRVALALDTTGSMSSDGKMDALKSATKSLLTELRTAATVDGDVYVSIIPFSKNVNLNPANHGETWIDWTDWEAEPDTLDPAKGGSKPSNWKQAGPGSTCPFTNSSHGFVCAASATSTGTVSSIPSSGTTRGYICPSTDSGRVISRKIGVMYNGCYDSSLYSCTGSSCSCTGWSNCSCSGSGSSRQCHSTTDYVHIWRPSGTAAAPARSTWNGCVTDRGRASGPVSDYDRLATAPSTSITESLYPAEQNAYCSPTVMGLNYDWSSMSGFVDTLYPSGATNQPIGLVWGWQSLVGGGPLSVPAKDPNYVYSETIILLSDGLNTLNRWNGNGSSTSTSVDNRMYDSTGAGTCANIKAAGITIYTIHVNTDGDPTSTLLQNCASSPDKFFSLTSATQIITAFNKIGTDLKKLRLAY